MLYALIRTLMRGIFWFTMRVHRRGDAGAIRPGGYLLACSHAGHLDPFCLSVILPRRIDWMARSEFYQHPWLAGLLRSLRAFPVNRRGVPVSTIREAMRRLEAGEVVGVFPEGEVLTGPASVLRGGAIKRGVCLLAQCTGCPVLPCVILGADRLRFAAPWLPFRRGSLWVACGEFLEPRPGPDRRAGRAELAARIEAALRDLSAELRAEFSPPPSALP